MDIYVHYFSDRKQALEFVNSLKFSSISDIYITTPKADAPTSIILSNNFLDENLDWEYVESQGYTVERAPYSFGEYGVYLSIPDSSFTIMIPTDTQEQFSIPYVDAMFERLYGCKKPNYRTKTNDFMVGDKKVLGRLFFNDGDFYHLIGSLNSIPTELDKIFTDKWLENSGKTLPSERVLGYREAVDDYEATIEDFAEALKFRMNEQLKNTIQDIVVIDMDKGESK